MFHVKHYSVEHFLRGKDYLRRNETNFEISNFDINKMKINIQ